MATTAQRLAEYEDLYKKAQAYDPNAFQSEFEKAYGEATNYNQDLIQQQAQALGEVQAVAPTLRERYMNTLITDPTAQMSLIAQARQAPITSYGTAANLLTARGQRYQDILGKALGGYQTAAQQANTAAENAWRLYQDAVQQEQFNRSLRGSGGSGGLSDLLKDTDGDGIPDIFDSTNDLIINTDDDNTGGGPSWTQKLLNKADRNSVLGGADLTTLRPKTTKEAVTNALKYSWNPLTGIKTVGGAIGNLIGNRSNDDMTFMQKLFNLR